MKKADFGEALKVLEKDGKLNNVLKLAFDKLYGYTCGEEGIRHGLMEEPNVGFAEAKFMLVACSAFVNYVSAKSAD